MGHAPSPLWEQAGQVGDSTSPQTFPSRRCDSNRVGTTVLARHSTPTAEFRALSQQEPRP
eukprot:1790870-Prymnesium_polylepis.1